MHIRVTVLKCGIETLKINFKPPFLSIKKGFSSYELNRLAEAWAEAVKKKKMILSDF